MADLRTGLSVTFEIGGHTVPVRSDEISIPDGKSLSDAIKDAITQGMEFSLPPDHAVNVPLQEFLSWLSQKGLDLPYSLDSDTVITITSLTISTAGKFDISLLIQDQTGIIPDSLPLGDLIDITEMGLRLAFNPA